MADLTPEEINTLARLLDEIDEASVDALPEEQALEVGLTARRNPHVAAIVSRVLNRKGWSYKRLGQAFGVEASTVFRWVEAYERDQRRQP